MTDAVLRVRLLEPDAKAPTVAHPGSDLGFDLYALEDVVLEPGVMTRVRTGIAVEGPDGYGFVLGDRSSMAARGVTYAGGRIDAGYRGEILVCLVNVNQPAYTLAEDRDASGVLRGVTLVKSDVAVHLHKGDKIVQMTPLRACTQWPVTVVESLAESRRGERGFGSSGR
ncbi:MAG TPA: dUTP diphosphatase [Acidobacteriaceae bacterium]|jgi:dUTP pyrophosphatase